MIMSNHVIGGVSTAATDTTVLPFNPCLRKGMGGYDGRKDQLLSKLKDYVVPDSWPGVWDEIKGASDKSLKQAKEQVDNAIKKGLDADTWSAPVKTTNIVRKVVVEILRNLNHEGNSTGIGTTVENNPGAETDMAADSGIQPTISVSSLPPPQPPLPSPSAPPQPEASPDLRPQKRQKLSDEQYVDITAELSSKEEEQQRKSSLDLVDRQAKSIISQLTKNERLDDNTIYIISQAWKFSHPSSKAPIQVLDTIQFDVDGEAIQYELKNDINWDESIYAPLHHRNSCHWTLCVMVLKSDHESGPEAESVSKSVCIDFYDSLEDKDNRNQEKVEKLFRPWIKDRYPECRIRFNRQKSARQRDSTSCGIFVLETIRRLHESQDVTRTIETMDTRRGFLDMINSLNITSPSISTELQVMARIQALCNSSDKAVIRAASPPPTQQPQSIPSPHRFIAVIKELIVQERMSITDELSDAEEKSRQLAGDEERLGSELKTAEEELDTAIKDEKAFLFEIFKGQLENELKEVSKKATESMNTWLAGLGKQAREEGNTPLASDDRNTHVGKVRSRKDGMQVDQIHSLIQGAIQAERDDGAKGTVEDQKKALRPFSEKVESAQTNVDGREKQVKDVKAEKAQMDSLILVYRGLSGLQEKCGREAKVP